MSAFVRTACVAVASAIVLAACAGSPSSRVATSQSLDAILAGAHRSEANRARDPWRHPKEPLLFFGLRPEMSVVEIWPDPSGRVR